MLAFTLEKGSRCVLCGTAAWEWEENRFAYEPTEKTCHGCYLKEITSRDSTRSPGVSVELLPTGTVQAAQRRMKARNAAARKAARRDEQ